MPKDPRTTPCRERHIGVLAFPAVQLLDVTGPVQVFASANDFAARADGARPYRLRVVAPTPTVLSSAGLGLAAEPLAKTGPPQELDTLIVAGGEGVGAACDDPLLIDWVQKQAARTRRVASVCTGAFLLGSAGLLEGRRVVTHWKYCEQLSARFPNAKVEPDPIFIRDGKVWTSAGITAGIDLALALVEEDLGRAVALAVARYLVVFLKRPGGQAQFSAALALQGDLDDGRFGALHAWINDHLTEPMSLATLAERAGMSERTFSRRYTDATGMTPAKAVERLKVEAACRLLSDSKVPIKRIAQRCGFGSEETLRRAFLRLLAVTPQDYRERFPAL